MPEENAPPLNCTVPALVTRSTPVPKEPPLTIRRPLLVSVDVPPTTTKPGVAIPATVIADAAPSSVTVPCPLTNDPELPP
jgi:hypothetical protein